MTSPNWRKIQDLAIFLLDWLWVSLSSIRKLNISLQIRNIWLNLCEQLEVYLLRNSLTNWAQNLKTLFPCVIFHNQNTRPTGQAKPLTLQQHNKTQEGRQSFLWRRMSPATSRSSPSPSSSPSHTKARDDATTSILTCIFDAGIEDG